MQESTICTASDFRSTLRAHTQSRRFINMRVTSDDLCRTVFSYDVPESENTIQRFLTLHSCSDITYTVPLEFSFDPMDCLMMLYTKSGGGRIRRNEQTMEISGRTLILMSCSEYFRLSSFLLPWEFEIFWIRPDCFAGYDIFLKDSFCSVQLDEYSSLPSRLRELCTLPSHIIGSQLLTMHRLLTDVMCEAASAQYPEQAHAPRRPVYLEALKEDLDRNYSAPFSLSKYENQFGVSHYRLCREFSAAYGVPPMRYLKTVRIEKAKAMLLTTSQTVGEISMAVGYENVNNFILHFRDLTGMTPGAWRKRG